jgi:hypothetical protein
MRYGGAERKRTRHGARRGRLTCCDAAPSGGEGRRRRDSVSGDAIRRGDEEMHDTRRAARSTHGLRRGAERGRGEAEEGQRERRCDMARRRRNARYTARSAAGSPAAMRRRAGARGGRRRDSVSGDAIWRVDEETHEARRAARSTHLLRRGAERGRGEAEEGQREWRCDMTRRRGNARGTASGAAGSPPATRRRAGARGGGGGAS